MLGLLIFACLLLDEQESYVLWMRAGTAFNNKHPWETARSDLPSRSGERHTYGLKVEEDGSANLRIHDPGKAPNEFLRGDMHHRFRFKQGDVFPLYDQLYLVDLVYFDKRRPEKFEDNLSKITLRRLTADELPRPAEGCITISSQSDQSTSLVSWDSGVPHSRSGVAVTKWLLMPDGESVTVQLRRAEVSKDEVFPRITEYPVRLKQGSVLEIRGKKIRLEQVVPPRDLGNNRRLTGWISFKGVAED